MGPYPFGPSLSAHFGLSVLTTVQEHVRVPTHSDVAHRHAPSGSGFSCFAPLASPIPLGVRQRHEGGAITSAPLRWELDVCPHPHAQQVIKGSKNLRLPSPWIAPSFGRTDHSPLRTDRDRFRINQLSSGLFRVSSNESPCCFGVPHLAYLTAPDSPATCATSSCTRLSRAPWWVVTSTSTMGTP